MSDVPRSGNIAIDSLQKATRPIGAGIERLLQTLETDLSIGRMSQALRPECQPSWASRLPRSLALAHLGVTGL